MRTTPALVALAGALWLGAAALAAPAVPDPFDVAGCGETDYVGVQMGDPNGAFTGVLDCTNLCRLAAFECRKLTKLTFSCQNQIVSRRATWSRANCIETITTDPAALKTCKLAAKSQAATDKATVKSNLHNASAACESWSSVCQSTCQ
jgi:hypothetical protein